MIACKKGNIEICEYLIQSGANVNQKNILGDTALKISQQNNHDDLSLLLVSKYKATLKLKK